MQREVQRYVRDILRIAAEIIANKFAPETLAAMTNLTYPTQAQKLMAQQQMQMRAQGSAQAGQQPPPPDPATQAMLSAPTWEDITGLMRKDMLRQFKVDVETDSTVAGSLNDDMAGMSQVVQALGGAMQVFAPAVQQGFLPLEAAKEIALAVVRRAKMGLAVEDALEKMQPPPPPQPPQDNSLQVAQVNAQKDQQIAQLQAQHEQQMKGAELQASAQSEAAQKQHEAAIEQMRIQAENARAMQQQQTQREIAAAENQTRVLIADMQARHDAQMQQAKLSAEVRRAEIELPAAN